MNIESKICGLSSLEAIHAAAQYGAQWAGFVFYPPSPRNVSFEQAARLVAHAAHASGQIRYVGLLVNPRDDQIDALLDSVPLHALQLAGDETARRVLEVKTRLGMPIFKTLHVASADDFPGVQDYAQVADRLLIEPPPPKNGLPGGNALPLDWPILQGLRLPVPWFLAGGLTPENLAQAVAQSSARAVDVSSGVEEERGVKSPQRIRDFLRVAQQIPHMASPQNPRLTKSENRPD